ncbi:hypothetical protein GGF32_008581 [Allomyces javanicus]|nr:hypothetical protein GGF32_008581 [Allomyces javanicus]
MKQLGIGTLVLLAVIFHAQFLNDQGYLSCTTARPSEGPSSLNGRCECECDYPDPGHKGLMPQTQRFPVPQQRTSPDMPLELRKALNATVGRVV